MMRPAQLRDQRLHDLGIGKDLGEAHHVEQVAPAEPTPELGPELFRKRLDDQAAVFRTFLAEHLAADAAADLPVQQREPGVDDLCNLLPRGADHLADVGGQLSCRRHHRRFRPRCSVTDAFVRCSSLIAGYAQPEGP